MDTTGDPSSSDMDEVTEFTVVQHEGTDSEESLSEGETRKRKAEDQKRETEN